MNGAFFVGPTKKAPFISFMRRGVRKIGSTALQLKRQPHDEHDGQHGDQGDFPGHGGSSSSSIRTLRCSAHKAHHRGRTFTDTA